jgi:hypothetical protein
MALMRSMESRIMRVLRSYTTTPSIGRAAIWRRRRVHEPVREEMVNLFCTPVAIPYSIVFLTQARWEIAGTVVVTLNDTIVLAPE